MTGSFPSPETITRAELPSGVTVLAYETHGSPSVVMSGYLWAGALSEPRSQAGLANLTAALLTHGTETRSFSQINDALESVGAQLGFGSATHTVGFGGKALAEDLDLLLGILADCLCKPTFPDREVEKLQGQILTGLERRAHDTRQMARLTFHELLYPDHPYGASVDGYPDTVGNLDRQDVVRYYADHYSPQGLVISIVGAVPPQIVVDKVWAALGSWEAPDAQPNRSMPPAVGLDEQRRRIVPIEGKTQADIVLGWPAMARSNPDFLKAYLANTILGIFGMMGRLGDSVRDGQGLAYYVYSRLEAGLGIGPWLAIAGVNPANVERAIDAILYEVRRLRDEPVPEEELADSQAYLTGSIPLHLETNEGISATLLEIERHGLGLDYLQRYEELVRDITARDVQQVARTYLDPGTYVLAVAGPSSEERG
jgi:zinc protease